MALAVLEFKRNEGVVLIHIVVVAFRVLQLRVEAEHLLAAAAGRGLLLLHLVVVAFFLVGGRWG